jgi:hypothetical protein
MFVQRNNKLFKINVEDKPVKHVEVDGLSFIIDPSRYMHTEHTCLSLEHDMFLVHSYVFYLKNLHCVVEGKMTTHNFNVSDMFFVPKPQKEESYQMDTDTIYSINEFLSLVM